MPNDSADEQGFAAYIPAIAGWVLPGLGHFWQGRWGRGLLLLISILGLFLIGLGLRGKLFPWESGDIVDRLGMLAQGGSGGLFLLTHFFGYAAPEPSTAMADQENKGLMVMPKEPLKPGDYKLDWHAVASDDGHRTAGTLNFTVK